MKEQFLRLLGFIVIGGLVIISPILCPVVYLGSDEENKKFSTVLMAFGLGPGVIFVGRKPGPEISDEEFSFAITVSVVYWISLGILIIVTALTLLVMKSSSA